MFGLFKKASVVEQPQVQVQPKVKAKIREVLDPIAVLEVRGGYIIMNAWEKEAEIPEIINPVLN
jgi:hypothetical protein